MGSPYNNDVWWWCDGYPIGNGRINQLGKHHWAYTPYTTGCFKKVEHDYWTCGYCGRQTDILPVDGYFGSSPMFKNEPEGGGYQKLAKSKLNHRKEKNG